MAKATIEPKEILKKKLKTKEVYFCTGEDFEVMSREVFKNGSEIHYPFDTRNGSQKYKYIRSISFDGVSPKNIHGVYKDWSRGMGFTRYLSPVVDFLENYVGISKVTISKGKNSQLKTTEVVFHVDDIESLYQRIRPFRDQQSGELKDLTRDLFSSLFPAHIKKEPAKYYQGQLARLVENKSIKAEQLSPNDIKAISELLTSLPESHPFIKSGKVFVTKEKFEVVSIEATLREFKKFLTRKNETKKLEEAWHQFFKKYPWIFSQMFASPMVFFDDKAYVGGKDLKNQKGKVADFIYQNSFSRSTAIIEIKTHKTLLIASRPYRSPDVFSISKELSGAINQVLDQKDTLQKEYHSVTKGIDVESFNPLCIVVVGQISSLKKNHIKSFELFRNNCKDVHVVTFDELLKRIETVLEIFTNKPKKSKKKG